MDTPTKLDLGCGIHKKEGYFGVDYNEKSTADLIHDLRVYPWPFETESIEDIFCSHFFEHLAGEERIPFMEECYRILQPGKQMMIAVPYWNCMRAIQDPTHKWPPVAESSFLYFNKKWREDNKIDHYNISCNFDFTYGYILDGDMNSRNVEYQSFAVKHYTNAALDMQVTLTKLPA